MYNLKVLALKRYPEKGSKAEILTQLNFIKGEGAEGDYHTDISILSKQASDWMQQVKDCGKQGLCFNKFKENILIDLTDAPSFSGINGIKNIKQLAAKDLILQVLDKKKFCFKECDYFKEDAECPLSEGAAFACVQQSGTLTLHQQVEILQ